jgi:hypothetical protein
VFGEPQRLGKVGSLDYAKQHADAGRGSDGEIPLLSFNELRKEGLMHKPILIATAVLSLVSFDHAMAKKTVHHGRSGHAQALTVYHRSPYGQSTRLRYDWQAADCDITNKTSLNTCSNGDL